MGTNNLHKILRELVTEIQNQKVSSHIAPAEIIHDNSNKGDYSVTVELTAFVSERIKKADPKLMDIILGILIVDNYKYLIKSTKHVSLEFNKINHLIFYEKLPDLEVLKELLKTDDKFYFEVFRNVIELYYLTSNDEFYFIQQNINKKMDDKFLKLDKTYIYDKKEYEKNLDLDLNSIIENVKNNIPEDKSKASMNVYLWNKAEEIYYKLKLLNIYNKEIFNQNAYDIVLNVYNMKKSEAMEKGIREISQIDFTFLYQIENASIQNYISSFNKDEEEKVSIIYYYIIQELKKEKITQKEQTKNPKQ